MNVAGILRLLQGAQERADAHEEALAKVYGQVIRGVGRTAARRFRERSTLLAATTPDWEPPPRPDDLIDNAAASRSARRRARPVHERALESVVRPVTDAVGISFAVAAPLGENLLKQLAARSEMVTEGIADVVADAIRSAHAKGLSVPETAKLISARVGSLSAHQALLLARSDLVAIANGGNLAAVQAANTAGANIKTKTWLTARDGLVRPSHQAAEGQTVPIDQPFLVGAGSLQYPGDPSGPAAETWNCRCTTLFGEVPAKSVQPTATPPRPELGERARELLGDFADTQARYRTPNGDYLPERHHLHRHIAQQFLSEAKPTTSPRATFLAGGSGSGKSSILRRLENELPPSPVRIDPDAIKEMLPEYQDLLKAGERSAARLVHEESSDIAKAILGEANRRKLNIVIDGTGDADAGKFLAKISRQVDEGYETTVVLVDVPTDIALERAAARAARTGREVPEPVVRAIHQKVALRFDEWRDSPFVQNWQLWANEGIQPALIAERRGGVTRILDRARYEQAIAKGRG